MNKYIYGNIKFIIELIICIEIKQKFELELYIIINNIYY